MRLLKVQNIYIRMTIINIFVLKFPIKYSYDWCIIEINWKEQSVVNRKELRNIKDVITSNDP